ncbi:unnamed protein product [[Candida] boidinii]|nr:unnamed protein product [[Candida] boidinii]
MFDFNSQEDGEINETQSEPIAQLDSTNLNRFKSFKSEHTSSIFMDLNDLKNELYPDTEVSYTIGDDTTDHMETNNRIKSLTLKEKLMNELNNTENNESSHDGNDDDDDDDDDYEDIESDEEDQDDHFKSSTRSLPVRPLVILKGPRNKPADYDSSQSASKYNEQYSKDDDTDNDDSDNNSRTTSSAFLSTTSSYYPNTNSMSHKHNQNNQSNDNNSMNSYSTKSSNELFDAKSVISEVSNNIDNNSTDNIDKLKENFVLSLSSDSSSSDYSILNGEDLFKLSKQKHLKPKSSSNSSFNSGSNSGSGSGSESGVLSDTTNFTSISQRPINPRYLEMERLYNQQQQQRIHQQQGQYHNNNNQSMKFKKMSRNPIVELSDDIIKNERISKNNHANIVNIRNNNNQRIGYNVNFT